MSASGPSGPLVLLVLLFVLEIFRIEKKPLKMTSQLLIFRAFFRPATLNLNKHSHKSTKKKILALIVSPELGYPNNNIRGLSQ